MIESLLLTGAHAAESPDEPSMAAALARLRSEFPSVPVAFTTEATGAVWLDVRAWRDPAADLFEFDEQVFAAASAKSAALALHGEANVTRLAGTALQVLTRYQSLLDRRNPASSGERFDALLARHASLHDLSKPLVRADYAHARDVWQWILRLKPDADLPVQVAALFHDIERLASEADARVEQHASDYQAFKDAHAQAGARMTLAALDGLGLDGELRRRIAFLVSRHERPQHDDALTLLNDADALSFFSLNSPGFLRYYGPEHTRKKVAYTLGRLSRSARGRLGEIRLVPEIAAMVADNPVTVSAVEPSASLRPGEESGDSANRADAEALTLRLRSRSAQGDRCDSPTTGMKWVIFGLSVSSAWGNGHATLWRGLIKALAKMGHRVLFFERDLPFYASSRDVTELPEPCELILYPDWQSVRGRAEKELQDADVAMVTSYCPDGIVASERVLGSSAEVKAFYDLDTPITLERTRNGETVDYIGPDGLRGFDVVLSFTGGRALTELEERFGARRAVPLYGSVDPTVHFPVEPRDELTCALSYLGTYAANRQPALEKLFLAPARTFSEKKFVLGGSQYPQDFPWTQNLFYLSHVPPEVHRAFFCSSQLTLNVTRGPMAEMGFCPSGRLFEAGACRTPVLTDTWEGLEEFFTPGEEILVAKDTADALAALSRSPEALKRIGERAYERVMAEHTAEHRARELVEAIASARSTSQVSRVHAITEEAESVRG